MEELSIEQKAKAYDKALERAKELLEVGLKDTRDKRVVLSFFPELAESEDNEDKWIREGCINYLNWEYQHCPFNEDKMKIKKCIAWLEKRGQTFTKKDIDDAYLKGICDAKHELEKQGEQKPTEWSEEDTEMFGSISSTLSMYMYNTDIPSDIREIHKKEYAWFNELYNRVFPQPKQEWSKEDEREVAVLKAYICSREWSDSHIDRALGIVDELVKKLKSLRPQSTWKPSDEQMEYLAKAITTLGDEGDCKTALILNDLRFELKKLKGE